MKKMDKESRFTGLHSAITEKVLEVAFAVSNELGSGFFESVYRRSLLMALRQAGLQAEEEVAIPVEFRGAEVGIFYADLIVNGLVILELKVGDTLTNDMEAQLIHYLRSSDLELGLVLVFGTRVRYRRIILDAGHKHRP